MLQNVPTLAIVAVDTGENEPPKVWKQNFHCFNWDINMNKLYLIWNKNKLVIEEGHYYLDRFKLNNVKLINFTFPELGIIKIQRRKNELILISDTINSIELCAPIDKII